MYFLVKKTSKLQEDINFPPARLLGISGRESIYPAYMLSAKEMGKILESIQHFPQQI